MDETRLSQKELLYLSVLSGMGNMWGFPDPFSDIEDDEISACVLKLQADLVKKGCLIADERGNLLIEARLRDRLLFCRDCRKIYVLSSSAQEKQHYYLRFFTLDGQAVRYECGSEAVLSVCDEEWLRSEIFGFFETDKGEKDPSFFKISTDSLRRMGSLSKQHFLQELRNCGCEESLSLLIADGLQGSATFKSLLVYSCQDKTETLESKLVTLEFDRGSLIITAGQYVDRSICITCMSPEKLRNELKLILGENREAAV